MHPRTFVQVAFTHFLARLALIVVSLVLISGCVANKPSQVDPQARAAIGEAATANYPTRMGPAGTAAPAAAVDYPRQKELEIYNLGDSDIVDARIWVNGAYVRRVGTIPPRGSVMVLHANLLKAGQASEDFTMVRQPVTKVEIETPQGLYPVSGPAIKQ